MSPNRFNVSITRPKRKYIVIMSRKYIVIMSHDLIDMLPEDERLLESALQFK
ncbi:MAG: hypothetical protein ACTSP4_05565 [Candidatus Hodarchaeales archaeon]